nr:trigger factor [Alphaproteobacteria bacterium]
CVVSEIAKKEKISVTRNEIAQAIKNIAMMYPGHEKSIVDLYSRRDTVQAVAGPILENKVIDFLLQKLKIKEEKCSIAELTAIDEEPFDFFADDKAKKAAPKKKATAVKKEADKKEEAAPKKRSCKCKKSAE